MLALPKSVLLILTVIHISVLDNPVKGSYINDLSNRNGEQLIVTSSPTLSTAGSKTQLIPHSNQTRNEVDGQGRHENDKETPQLTPPSLMDVISAAIGNYQSKRVKRDQLPEPPFSNQTRVLVRTNSSSTSLNLEDYSVSLDDDYITIPMLNSMHDISPSDQTPMFKSLDDLFVKGALAKHDDTEEQYNVTTDYCNLGENHTMCIYEPRGCKRETILSNTLSYNETVYILHLHNELRHYVSLGKVEGLPTAYAPMQNMKWDPELADIAQRWADQCTLGPDINRRTEHFENVSQTMSWWKRNSSITEDPWKGLSDVWYNGIYKFTKEYEGDVQHFGRYKIEPENNDYVIGSFTQVVWANTLYVGCGLTYTKDDQWYYAYQVCNYAPGGNIDDSPIYVPVDRNGI